MPLKYFGVADEHSNRFSRKHKKYTFLRTRLPSSAQFLEHPVRLILSNEPKKAGWSVSGALGIPDQSAVPMNAIVGIRHGIECRLACCDNRRASASPVGARSKFRKQQKTDRSRMRPRKR